MVCEIWGSYGSDCEDLCLLTYNALQSGGTNNISEESAASMINILDTDRNFLWNVGTRLPDYTASHQRGQYYLLSDVNSVPKCEDIWLLFYLTNIDFHFVLALLSYQRSTLNRPPTLMAEWRRWPTAVTFQKWWGRSIIIVLTIMRNYITGRKCLLVRLID
jgi:hypothetical protein